MMIMTIITVLTTPTINHEMCNTHQPHNFGEDQKVRWSGGKLCVDVTGHSTLLYVTIILF